MSKHWHLFERFGVELEYMIVDAQSLDVRPLADKIVHTIGSERKNEVKHGKLRWSNELVLHVIELKTDGPARRLEGLANDFQTEVRYLNQLLSAHGCKLLPTAAHPWMDPIRETYLWPHGDRAIYQTFDRIFNCQGHGWSNLQSTHLNLPFKGDEEFHRLHAAIRLVLPLLPALAASSPILESHQGSYLDMRLQAYRANCARVPSITGRVVPEVARGRQHYEETILQPIYDDLVTLDPGGILRDEWVNARGAIARFSRGTIEIRVLDIQENPQMDLDLIQGIVCLLERIVGEHWCPLAIQDTLSTESLAHLFELSMRDGLSAVVSDPNYLRAFGLAPEQSLPLRAFLEKVLGDVVPAGASWGETLNWILRHGNLSERILRATGRNPQINTLRDVYQELGKCLGEGVRFNP